MEKEKEKERRPGFGFNFLGLFHPKGGRDGKMSIGGRKMLSGSSPESVARMDSV